MRTIFALILFLLTCPFNGAAQTPLKMRDSTIKGPQTFAMIVGISKYRYVRPLNFADKDAELFRDYLKSPGGGGVKEENIFCLLNDKALNSTFWTKGFQWLNAKQLRKGDKLFIYLAGHGDAIDEDQFFFLTFDCNPGGDKNSYLSGGAIQLFNLKKKIAAETTKGVEVYFIMDACRSNELPGGAEGLNFLNTAISQKKVGEVMMLAAAAGQESLEDASIGSGHGLFTWYLVDGLSGMADNARNPDQKITLEEIRAYVDNNVPTIAQQRFRRQQQPYFCCNENSSKIVGTVDTTYLARWIKEKQKSRAGDAFSGIHNRYTYSLTADTLLMETYNKFYQEVNRRNLSGPSSAEEYFLQLNKKFPGNPYTLDAKTTLAAEFINGAQARMNLYLDCMGDVSTKGKQNDFELAAHLEKAIQLMREEEPDFAASLMGQMYFLKACGDFGTSGKNGPTADAFQYAYAALAVHPNGAYIQNKLALLHLENNNPDSARYYADKATKTAPKWNCALATLALVQKALTSRPEEPGKQVPRPRFKNSFGIVVAGGLNKSQPSRAANPNSNIVGVTGENRPALALGLIYQVGLSENVSIRPSTQLSFEGGDVVFERRPTAGNTFFETVRLDNVIASLSAPIVFRLSTNKVAPFFSIGPSFSYLIKQNTESAELLPLKSTAFLADAGLGVDIEIRKAGLILSPEVKYTQGLSNMQESGGTVYANALSSLKRNAFTLNLYVRKR